MQKQTKQSLKSSNAQRYFLKERLIISIRLRKKRSKNILKEGSKQSLMRKTRVNLLESYLIHNKSIQHMSKSTNKEKQSSNPDWKSFDKQFGEKSVWRITRKESSEKPTLIGKKVKKDEPFGTTLNDSLLQGKSNLQTSKQSNFFSYNKKHSSIDPTSFRKSSGSFDPESQEQKQKVIFLIKQKLNSESGKNEVFSRQKTQKLKQIARKRMSYKIETVQEEKQHQSLQLVNQKFGGQERDKGKRTVIRRNLPLKVMNYPEKPRNPRNLYSPWHHFRQSKDGWEFNELQSKVS